MSFTMECSHSSELTLQCSHLALGFHPLLWVHFHLLVGTQRGLRGVLRLCPQSHVGTRPWGVAGDRKGRSLATPHLLHGSTFTVIKLIESNTCSVYISFLNLTNKLRNG